MKLTKRKTKLNQTELNLPAMVDVILLLLIFFMCTHSFNQPENTLESKTVKQGKNLQEQTKLYEPILISISGNSKGISIRCDGNVCENFNSLEKLLSKYRQFGEIEIIIKSSKDVPFEYLVEAIDRCKLIGFDDVGFSTSDWSG